MSEHTVAHSVRGLFRRDSLYLVVWAVQIVTAAALTPVITRVMGPTEFGGVAAAIAVMQVLFVLAGMGLQTAIQRHYAGQDGMLAARRLLMLSLMLATVVTVAIDMTGPVWSRYLGFDHYGGAVRLAVFWAGASAVTYSALGLLRCHDRLAAFSFVSLLQSVVAEAMSLLMVVAVSPTATNFILGRLLAQIMAAGLALSLAPPKALRPRDTALVRAALLYALPLVPALLSSFVLDSADRLVIQHELGPTAVARYQIAYNIGDLPMILMTFLNMVWLPRIFALEDNTERAAVLAASRDALYRLLMPVVIGLSVGAPLVLRVWAPPAYRLDELLLVTSVVIVTVVPYAGGLAASRALLAQGHTIMVAGATIAAAGVNLGLNFVLVPRWELIGSAVSTFVAFSALHGLLVLRARFVAPIPGTSGSRLLELAAAIAVALLAAALPTTVEYLLLRAFLVVVALGWFGWTFSRVSVHPTSSRG
jgi:O-antigen/teichoic acid export membrane protein